MLVGWLVVSGVYTTTVDADQGKVTVSGNVDPATLIKRLAKSGKYAVLVSPKLQLVGNGGGQRNGGGNDNQKNQQVVSHLQQPKMKDFNLGQMKMAPFIKEPKSVKFDFRPLDDDESGFDDDDLNDGFDDDDDDDEYYDDGSDGFDDVFAENIKQIKNGKHIGSCDKKGSGGGNAGINRKKDGGGGGGPGGGYVNMQNKHALGGKDGKNGTLQNGKKGGGGGQENGKKVVQSISNYHNQGSNKGGNGGGLYPTGAINNIAMHPMTHMGNGSTGVQAIGGPSPVYYHGGPSPELTAPTTTNPYLSAMMQQQQQQQRSMMMMNNNNGPSDRTFQPMAYSRPSFPVNYIPPPPPEYTHFFSDENTGTCSVM